MDELNLYDDLDDFQEQQEKKSKELQEAEEKYQQALKTIEELREENKTLKKNIQRIELGFQSLLDTARNEIKRKDKEIERLRKENDDICFRRKIPQKVHERSNNPFNKQTKDDSSVTKTDFHKINLAIEKTETLKRSRFHDSEAEYLTDHKRHRGFREHHVDDVKEGRSHREHDNDTNRESIYSREGKEYDKHSAKRLHSPERYDKHHRKSSRSPQRYDKNHRNRSGDRDRYDNEHHRKRSCERNIYDTATKGPQRYTETKRDHYQNETNSKEEFMKSHKSFDKDEGPQCFDKNHRNRSGERDRYENKHHYMDRNRSRERNICDKSTKISTKSSTKSPQRNTETKRDQYQNKINSKEEFVKSHKSLDKDEG